MPVLFEKPSFWRCEQTDRGIFFVHFIARSLARASGRTNLRTFDTRAECEAWLLA